MEAERILPAPSDTIDAGQVKDVIALPLRDVVDGNAPVLARRCQHDAGLATQSLDETTADEPAAAGDQHAVHTGREVNGGTAIPDRRNPAWPARNPPVVQCRASIRRVGGPRSADGPRADPARADRSRTPDPSAASPAPSDSRRTLPCSRDTEASAFPGRPPAHPRRSRSAHRNPRAARVR